jgi:hypothetical protein
MRVDLRFTCQPGCTNCCNQQGFVYLTEADLKRASRHLKMSPAAFEGKYVYRTKNFLRLRKPRNSQCHFLTGSGCSIHPNKPTQCRLFPFWPELIENRKEWRRTSHRCPGIGQGELIQIGDAVETASAMRAAYPEMYR